MKKLILIFVLFNLIIFSLSAQAPHGINYQAIARDVLGEAITNQAVSFRISLLHGGVSGPAVFIETHDVNTNQFGLVNMVIGQGIPLVGNFETINWAEGPYFMQTELDAAMSGTYTLMGTTQLLSVPYALHAATAASLSEPPEETDPVFSSWDKSTGIVISESQINDLQPYLTNLAGESIGNLGDVNLSGIASGKILKFNGSTGQWVIADDSGVGDETDPIFSMSAAAGIMPSHISNWNTAHLWGNHAAAGYLTGEYDPVFITSPAFGITGTNINNWNTAFGWGNHSSAGYLTNEFDPVFSTSPSFGITVGNISNWNTAHSWGDHAMAGYITGSRILTINGIAQDLSADRSWNVGSVTAVSGELPISVSSSTTTPLISIAVNSASSSGVVSAGSGQADKVWKTDASGNPDWRDDDAGEMPPGINMQTLRHDGSEWVANSLLKNNGTGLGVNANPIANTQLVLFRPDGNFGAGYANIYAVRDGNFYAAPGGTSWSLTGADAAIKGFSNWGNNFSAAVAGYSYLDYTNSAAVIGSTQPGDKFGALAFKDGDNTLWAGYFKGNANITGTIRIQGGSPGAGKVLTSDADGAASWEPAIQTYQIGDFVHGGVVFYVEPCGTKGLVCSMEDLGGGALFKWRGGNSYYNTMARGEQIYGGKMNTSIIVAVHTAKGDFDNHAALVCANYTGEGYSDWYLPSRYELFLIYLNRFAINTTLTAHGGITLSSAYYWSSTEDDSSHAWRQHFVGPTWWSDPKSNLSLIRAVRNF